MLTQMQRRERHEARHSGGRRRGLVDWAVDVFMIGLTTACFWACADSLPRPYVTGLMTFLGAAFGLMTVLDRRRR